MNPQNIFDNETFYEGYKKIRDKELSANNVEEKPALFSLLPNIEGKKILDLGCGFGENCKAFSQMGASSLVGIDISKKMLAVAEKENSAENIRYVNMGMEDLEVLNEKFDLVISSLAIHYVSYFDVLVKEVYSLLNDNGVFIFSQEHPLSTAPKDGVNWIKDSSGEIQHYALKDYCLSGERSTSWLVDNVIKYHRTFSDIFNYLISSGFNIEKIIEPIPSEELIKLVPSYKKNLNKPNFLLIRARKIKNIKG